MAKKAVPITRLMKPQSDKIRHSSDERIDICVSCKKPFAQEFRPEYDNYTNFKMCPACRMANARGGINLAVEYEPHWGQKLVHDSDVRFKVLSCGARWGKDRCSVMEGIRYFIQILNEDRPVSVIPHALWWIIAPTENIARQNWRELLANLPKELIVDISKSTHTVETINGGIIEIHSAYDPESLVAVGLDLVTITEAARISDLEEVWSNLEARLNSPGRGLNGKGGVALINSSPLGQNYFYTMWKWGQKNTSDYDPDWESWRFSTWDNPYMAVRGNEVTKNGRTYKENLKKRMSDKRYRQDYEAEFLTDKNVVFPNYEKVLVKAPTDDQKEKDLFWKEWEEVDPYETYTIAYDPASKGDGKPCGIRNSKGRVVKIDHMSYLGWDAQWDRLLFHSRRYNNAKVIFGQTGLGETIGSQLIKRGLTVEPKNEQGRNKEKLVENLALIVEQGWCQIPWSQEMENQMKDYISINRNGQSTQYKNSSSDGFDDLISMLYFLFSEFEIIEDEGIPYTGIMGGVNSSTQSYDVQ